jgi:tetratricopeptide (TPR) repeat protein
MNVKTVFAFAAIAMLGASAALMPAFAAAQTQGADSRAELYRRNLLAGKDVACRTNASCAALGVAALEAGRVKDAQTLVAMEAALAEAAAMRAAEENSPKATSSARSRVAMALVHQGDVQQKLGAFSDARAYYRSAVSRGDDYPNDALLGRAVAAARQRLEAISHKAVVTGIPPGGARFSRYMFFGAWNSIDVTPVKGRRGVYRIDGDFVYPTVGPDGLPSANMGSMSAYVRFFDGVARVPMTDVGGNAPIEATARIGSLAPYEQRNDKCLIEFTLAAPETLDVRTRGSMTACGFGFNVSADGRYYLMTGR